MIYVLVLVAAAARFLPHPPNVACIGALGLIAGCYVGGRRAYLVPIIALGLSDAIGSFLRIPAMGFYAPIAMASVYVAVLASVPLGRWIAGRGEGRHRLLRVPMASVAASTIFFIVSNAGVIAAGWYPATMSGIAACYINAIPFYGYTLAGDLAFSTVMFSAIAFQPRLFGSAIPATTRTEIGVA